MISILIITYGREKEIYETLRCIQQYSRNEPLELLILDNNFNNKLEENIKKFFKNNKNINLKYFNEGINYGVALGRNYLIKKATGDILVTLDDDIEIEDINNLIEKIKNYFNNNLQLGCLAFNIKNFYTKKRLRHEIPHGNKKLNFENNLYTYYFIGAGHAIKKEVYNNCGLYPKDLGKYGGEERDLSFRIFKNYDILYVSDIIIFHKVSPNGRMKKTEENFYRYRNQLIVLNRYMPLFFRLSANIIWTIYYLIKMNGNISSIYNVFKEIKILEKNTIGIKELIKIKKLQGRILY